MYSPIDIAVDPQGIVYVISSSKIVKRALDGDWEDITLLIGYQQIYTRELQQVLMV